MNPVSRTISYYDQNAAEYCDRTLIIDMAATYHQFLRHLPSSAKILDAGCGSGRDTKYFKEKGYTVVAMDASIEMVRKSSQYTGQETLHLSFEELDRQNEFDGVWCSASLLHIPSSQIVGIFKRIKEALKTNGIWFMNFYAGNLEDFRGERYYLDMKAEKLRDYVNQTGGLEIVEMVEMPSTEKGRDITWIHCIVKKRESK